MSDTPTMLQDRLASMAHAFSDDGRKYAVRLLAADVGKLERELTEAKRGAARYEVVRKMTSDDFRKLYLRCLFEDLRFDDEVDKIGGIK